jgi:hypothetical protein
VGKRDQERGKKGSGDSASDTDLIKDLDLRSERSSSAEYSESCKAETDEAAEADLYKSVRKRFPVGNPRLIREFIAERGAFVGEVLSAFADVDPAFIRRFTRSADPNWAAFHTCCKQGMLPPTKRRAPERAPPREARAQGDEAGWGALCGEARRAALLALWEKTARLYAGPPGEAARAEIAAELERGLARGDSREALERFVVEDVARRRGRAIGPIAGSS